MIKGSYLHKLGPLLCPKVLKQWQSYTIFLTYKDKTSFTAKNRRTVLREKKKLVKELVQQKVKLDEYKKELETLGSRNSFSKKGKDATYMQMKEGDLHTLLF